MCFFFSSRRRHTRCALVTGVQTCALPISGQAHCLIADTREPGGKAAQGLFISFPKTRRRGKGSGSPIDERVSLFPIIRLHGGIATSGEMRDAPRSPSAQEIAIFSQLPVSGRQDRKSTRLNSSH